MSKTKKKILFYLNILKLLNKVRVNRSLVL